MGIVNKKIISTIFICVFIMLTSCGFSNFSNKKNVFKVSDYNIWISMSSAWQEDEVENFDLRLENASKKINLSIFAYVKEDMDNNETLEDFFIAQNENLLSKRENVKVIEEMKMTEYDDKVIYSKLYSGKRNGNDNYYYLNLVSFKGTGDMAWILVNGTPSNFEIIYEEVKDSISKVSNVAPMPVR